MIPICAGGGRRINSEAKISCAEKDMKNLPRSIQYYIVKGSHIQKIMKEKKNREQRDSLQKTSSEENIREMSEQHEQRKNRCSSSIVYDN